MKRIALLLLAVLFSCSVLAANPAKADVPHVAENTSAQSDYVVFSPEYSDSKNIWEMWVLAYRTGSGNYTGAANTELDQCVSASLLSTTNSGAAAGTISALISEPFVFEDMMDIAGIRYYTYYELWKPCYLAAPGGQNTTLAKINDIEIHETREDQRILLIAECDDPAYALLCQLWLYASEFQQVPSTIKKHYGEDTEEFAALYSSFASDFYSDQQKLQKYCDGLIPETDYYSSNETVSRHNGTTVHYSGGYRKTDFYVSPSTDSIAVYIDSYNQ